MTFMFFWHIPNRQYGRVSFDTCSHRRAGAARVRMPEGFGSAWTKDRHTSQTYSLGCLSLVDLVSICICVCMYVWMDVDVCRRLMTVESLYQVGWKQGEDVSQFGAYT